MCRGIPWVIAWHTRRRNGPHGQALVCASSCRRTYEGLLTARIVFKATSIMGIAMSRMVTVVLGAISWASIATDDCSSTVKPWSLWLLSQLVLWELLVAQASRIHRQIRSNIAEAKGRDNSAWPLGCNHLLLLYSTSCSSCGWTRLLPYWHPRWRAFYYLTNFSQINLWSRFFHELILKLNKSKLSRFGCTFR